MSTQMDRITREAISEGLLELAPIPSARDERPWSIVAFTACAAWLSALPLIGLIIGLGLLSRNVEAISVFAGMPMLIVSVLVLRAGPRVSLFVEQLGVPGLLAGAALIAFTTAVYTESIGLSLGMLIGLAGVVAALVPQAWLRTLMGVAIGGSTASCLLTLSRDMYLPMSPRLPWSLVTCVWLMLQAVQRSIVLDAKSARCVAGLEAVSSGIAAVTLVGTIWSSPTFLVSAVFGNLPGGMWQGGGDGEAMRCLSVALALSGGLWLARYWPVLRSFWYAGLLTLCAMLAWWVPGLGAVLAMLFVCVEDKRYVLSSFATVTAIWLIGGLYYDFHWPLADKALLLGTIGIVMALIGRHAIAAPAYSARPQVAPQAMWVPLSRRTRISFLLCGLLVLGAVNAAIWQKEYLIKTGRTVFIELAPVDPRSLMQGDYMSLSFTMPKYEVDDANRAAFIPKVAARLGERGVARLLRYHDGKALAKDEFLIDLVRKDRGWVFVADTWYFREGEAMRWSKARYGEFRVTPDGKALLIGLRGPSLEKL